MHDPWWNPAVEAQAICRAHRIGQKNPVFAYRLIAQGSIEEKILDLQVRKRALVENILSDNERPPELSTELVDYLFAHWARVPALSFNLFLSTNRSVSRSCGTAISFTTFSQ
jgi:hypothetical protein